MSVRSPSPKFDLADDEVVAYRGLSSLALLGLLAGLAAPLAMFWTIFWLVPPVAISLSALALWRIAVQAPNVVGRPFALAGLFLGTIFLVAAPVDDAIYRYYIRREARQFAAQWIDDVRHGEVYKAHLLMIDPRRRVTTDGPLSDFYVRSDAYKGLLKIFLNEPVARTLFALGTDDQIRFYETAGEESMEDGDVVQSTYAVTYKDAQEARTTFFITLTMSRVADRGNGRREWTVARVDGGVRPHGW